MNEYYVSSTHGFQCYKIELASDIFAQGATDVFSASDVLAAVYRETGLPHGQVVEFAKVVKPANSGYTTDWILVFVTMSDDQIVATWQVHTVIIHDYMNKFNPIQMSLADVLWPDWYADDLLGKLPVDTWHKLTGEDAEEFLNYVRDIEKFMVDNEITDVHAGYKIYCEEQ